ncbi:type I polyketide synthase [Chondromyces apiculatus]|nr:type I polyketide synthase [Chondromyces apiculatus]
MSEKPGFSNGPPLSAVKLALLAQQVRTEREGAEFIDAEPIAIVGMGCRFPGGADGPERFWRLLRDGVDAVAEVPPERWDAERYYDPDPDAAGKMYTRYGAFLRAIDRFDAAFFKISPREAARMDPQQRLVLEVTWEALEDAALTPGHLAGTEAGVFIGLCATDFVMLQFADIAAVDAYASTGAAHSIIANRLSYLLDLHGPSMAIDTACSSSLVAVHLACQSLQSRECDVALAGGVNLILTPEGAVALSRARMMAPDGRCKVFDSRADGFVRGEGCGIIVLKRLSTALKNGDHVRAVIRGSASNQDGRSNGLTAPSVTAQQAVIQKALRRAHLDAGRITYVEAHGTGTSLGDPVEFEALKGVLGREEVGSEPCALGSVKTNIGHLEGAAGIAGLIKVVLALEHHALPPHLHFKELNPNIDMVGSRFTIPTELLSWAPVSGTRCAGVSSFGFGGTNAHVVLEEAPPLPRARKIAAERPVHMLTFSGRDEEALLDLARRHEHQLAEIAVASWADYCFTAAAGRAHLEHRLALMAGSPGEARELLSGFLADDLSPRVSRSQEACTRAADVVFLFTGQGSQVAGMGRELHETQPTFRHAIDRCAEILGPHLDRPLTSVLFPDGSGPEAEALLQQTAYTQPALFAYEYALAMLWRSWGIEPAAVMGHSLGEIVAACVAGALDLEGALRFVAERGRLMQALPPTGAMAAVFAGEARVAEALIPCASEVSIAAINGPMETVISGASESVAAVSAQLQAEGIQVRRLFVSHAFHSPQMDAIMPALERAAAELQAGTPRCALISNVTGQRIDAGELAAPGYWARHARVPVQFASGIRGLYERGHRTFLEIGPQPTLLKMSRRCLDDASIAWLSSASKGKGAWESLLESLGALYVAGAKVDWSGFDRDYRRRRVALPTYPFQRQHFPVERKIQPSSAPRRDLGPLLGRRIRSASREALFEAELSAEVQLLDEHRIRGMVLMPGAGYLALVLQAVEAALGRGPCAVDGVAFRAPLWLDDGERRVVQTILTPDPVGGSAFQVLSLPAGADGTAGEPWENHCAGRVRVGPEAAEVAKRAPVLAEVRARCGALIGGEDIYRKMAEEGYALGSSYRWISEVMWREGEALGRMRAPADADPGTTFRLHPGLLDACFQLFGVTWPAQRREGLVHVPVALERLQFHATPPSGELFCHVTLRRNQGVEANTYVGDLSLFSEDGQLVFLAEGLCVKGTALRASAPEAAPVADWVYQTLWQPVERREESSVHGVWLLFEDAGGTAAGLARRLQARGDDVYMVTPGERYAMTDAGRWTIDPASPADYRRLLEALGRPCHGAVYVWGLDAGGSTGEDASALGAQEQILGGALHLVQSLVAHGASATTRLWLVTRGTQVTGSERAAPRLAGAPLWGLGRVLVAEHPGLLGGLVDLPPVPEDGEEVLLCEAMVDAGGDDQQAVRGGTRLTPRLARRRDVGAPGQQTRLLPGATYLITGGTGALGLEVARWMVAQGARHLVLVSRTGGAGAGSQILSELENQGAHVTIERADIAALPEITAVLARIRVSARPLRGVVHAAGVIEDGVLLRQSWDRFERVLGPKAGGAAHLDRLTRRDPLDFFVMFSSIASLFGSPGQGNYAAANAYLDTLAHRRKAEGLPALSINWGPWDDVGMAATLPRRAHPRWSAQGMSALSASHSVEALGRLLQHPAAQLAVVAIDWKKAALGFAGDSPPRFLSPLLEQARGQLGPGSPVGGSDEAWLQLERANPAQRQRLLLGHVREVAARVLGLAPSAPIDRAVPLSELGLDSLMALDIAKGIERVLRRPMPPALVFNHPSMEAIVTYLEHELFTVSAASSPEKSRGEDVAGARTLSRDQVVALSDSDLEGLVAAELGRLEEEP